LATNWPYVIIRGTAVGIFLGVVVLSQMFWVSRGWRLADSVRATWLRIPMRVALVLMLALMTVALIVGYLGTRHRTLSASSLLAGFSGLWLLSAMAAYLGVRGVRAIHWLSLRLFHRASPRALPVPWASPTLLAARSGPAPFRVPPVSHSRRYFFQSAMYAAGALPFATALYGFSAERLNFTVERVDIPLAGLPPQLEGLRIAQLSDIHIGGYMPRGQVARAVALTNELHPDLTVMTGDFITGVNDPLETCIAELARLQAPLGVWGCNGNHEIYAQAEATAAALFQRYGMRLLRQENTVLRWNGAELNLIGVDYQRQRSPGGFRMPMIAGIEPLVRADIPNILLSHNPNSFPRAAEAGIQLSLAGHTHGGQVKVEILDRQWSAARFMTPFIAGLYSLPLNVAPGSLAAHSASQSIAPTTATAPAALSYLYVNRGLGTIGAPVRLGVPPEITLLTLRRA
jgi:uncharacterized protein